MQSTQPLFVFLTLVLTSSAIGQRTWVVDASGSAGSDFRTLSAAVTRAAAGDRIRVKAGVYKATTIRKPLALFAEPLVVLEVGPRDPGLVIEKIPPGTVCSIQGFSMTTGVFGNPITIRSCPGRVLLSEIEIPRSSAFGVRVAIDVCSAVTIDQCAFWAAVVIKQSRVLAVRSQFEMASAGAILDVSDSRVTLTQCSVNESGEARSLNTPNYVVQCDTSTLELRGDADSIYRGGLELRRQIPWIVQHAPLIARGASHLIRDPRVNLVGPRHWGFGTDVVQRRPFLTAVGGRLRETVALSLDSRPNEPFVLYVGLPAVSTSIPGLGDIWVDLRAFFPIQRGMQPAGGATAMRRAVPNIASLVGLALTYQAVAGTSPTLSNGATITVTDY